MKSSIKISVHAQRQMQERKISEDLVKSCLHHPGQIVEAYGDRKVAQSIVELNGEQFLIRVIFEQRQTHMRVVTVYVTKKIKKYWRE